MIGPRFLALQSCVSFFLTVVAKIMTIRIFMRSRTVSVVDRDLSPEMMLSYVEFVPRICLGPSSVQPSRYFSRYFKNVGVVQDLSSTWYFSQCILCFVGIHTLIQGLALYS